MCSFDDDDDAAAAAAAAADTVGFNLASPFSAAAGIALPLTEAEADLLYLSP